MSRETCTTCRGYRTVGLLKSVLRNGRILIIETRQTCSTCHGTGTR
ncbi:hypothetical protein Skr01_57260 [Sphaerisporangium krabiense]|uniref:DnaJ-class molecular chaperone n=1 Tax=Sphaerisporangium krabiense TaxID=763782 RepID=A0A7W8Z8V4_9ACTN|nr:hypothetical protein [Sphaerisporangium krabiense]MBB5629507.1 DnaJ-class molecular chaperone [Sphaerisporangium krabiense]GII65641.1 hypothetical protein Skr01_57260 [Sphaerisporangium krabiense]